MLHPPSFAHIADAGSLLGTHASGAISSASDAAVRGYAIANVAAAAAEPAIGHTVLPARALDSMVVVLCPCGCAAYTLHG